MKNESLLKEIPVTSKADVVVAGGGPAGFAAAIAAARSGADTLLVERFNCLGGSGTVGLVGPFAPTAGTNGGIYSEVIERLQDMGAMKLSWYYRIPNCFDVESYKYAVQIMCEDEGVKFLFNTFVIDTITKDKSVTSILVANKGGLQAISANVIIDATGDGDIAFYAGAAYEKGDKKGNCQPTSFIFNIGGVKKMKLDESDIVRLKEQFERARDHGEINLPCYVNSIWGWVDFVGEGSTIRDGEVTINLDMTSGIDGTDPQALTKAELDGRRQAWECLSFYRRHVPGGENAYIIKTAYQHGIRETRRILGKYYLTKEDALSAKKFDDGICKASSILDIHGPESLRHREEDWKKEHCVPEGDYYEIPYRCLVPEGIENLLVAGRCISSDRETNGSLRMMATCMATGQATGMAAALAINRNVKPSELSGAYLRKKLIEMGADI